MKVNEINISAIYDKNLSFLIGSGASSGLLPTLALQMKDAFGSEYTVETLATELAEDDPRRPALFMHYYKTCIRPAQILSRESISRDAEKELVLKNYRRFLETLLQLLLRRKHLDKRCNIFTTNYDPCFALAADELLQDGAIDFVLNDGSRGFTKRLLQVRNFNSYLCHTGIFERDISSIPQLNLMHIHGSIYWRKHNSRILVDYSPAQSSNLLSEQLAARIANFSENLADPNATIADLTTPDFHPDELLEFASAYNDLPIVNPTKWKFHETVFEEHYYQMLRLLSYELERPNSVLITFGFSFADEHIRSLLKRSLSNPRLQVFVCCFSETEADQLSTDFQIYPNVRFVVNDGAPLDFEAFNGKIFTLGAAQPEAAPAAAGGAS